MNEGVTYWDAARHEQNELLDELIWIEGDQVLWTSPGIRAGGERFVSTADFRPDRLAHIKRHGLGRAAQYIVEDLINEGLRARVHEQLRWNERLGRPSIQILPINLIGAMWLQFATAVDGDRDYGQCSVCASWFEIALGAGRRDKRYCSDACRMRAYRKRKAASTKPAANQTGTD